MESGMFGLALTILHNQSVGDSVATVYLAAAPPCAGDCERDGRVGMGEFLRSLQRATGNAAPDSCRAADHDRNGTVEDSEVALALHALFGC
jgi:hypothetical protein